MTDGRTKILDAAATLFGSLGYDRTSMDAVAKEAGVSKGLAYHHYTNKEALLVALVLQRLDDLDELTGQLRAEPDPRRRLDRLVGHLIADLEERPGRQRMMITTFLAGDGARVAAAVRAERPARFGSLLSEQRRLLGDLGHPDPDRVLPLFRAALQGLALVRLQEPNFPLRDAAAELVRWWSAP